MFKAIEVRSDAKWARPIGRAHSHFRHHEPCRQCYRAAVALAPDDVVRLRAGTGP